MFYVLFLIILITSTIIYLIKNLYKYILITSTIIYLIKQLYKYNKTFRFLFDTYIKTPICNYLTYLNNMINEYIHEVIQRQLESSDSTPRTRVAIAKLMKNQMENIVK